MNQPVRKIIGSQVMIRVRHGDFGAAESAWRAWCSAIASRLQIHHKALMINPSKDTPARCRLVSAVPSAATRKLLGTRKISVTLIGSRLDELATHETPLTIGRLTLPKPVA